MIEDGVQEYIGVSEDYAAYLALHMAKLAFGFEIPTDIEIRISMEQFAGRGEYMARIRLVRVKDGQLYNWMTHIAKEVVDSVDSVEI